MGRWRPQVGQARGLRTFFFFFFFFFFPLIASPHIAIRCSHSSGNMSEWYCGAAAASSPSLTDGSSITAAGAALA